MQIAFQQLPPDMQDRLAEFTRPGEALPAYVRALPQGGLAGRIVGIVFGVIFLGIAIVVGFAEHHWARRIFRDFERFLEEPQLYISSIGIFLGSMLVLFNAAGVRRLRRSRIRPTFLLTPIAATLVKTDSDPITACYFKDLKDFKSVEHRNKGRYLFTSLNFTFPDRVLSVNVDARERVEDLLNFLRQGPALIQSWVADGTARQRIAELDWIGAAAAAPAAPPPPRPAWDRGRNKFLASCAATLVLVSSTWAGTLLFWEFDRWDSARRYDSSSDYRSYLDYAPLGFHKKEAERHYDYRLFAEAHGKAPDLRRYLKLLPQGAHVEEARAQLREIYAAAEKAYLERAQKPDPQAAEGMRALLRHLAEQLTPQVTICFAPSEGTDGAAAAAAARAATGSSKIHGWGALFTADQNRAREDRIINVMQSSFRSVLTSDLFDLQEGLLDDPGPRFLVRYRVIANDYYTLNSQDALPIKERDIYPGVQFAFDFSLQVPGSARPPDPDPAKGFRLATTAAPAPTFNVRSSDDAEVYGKMVASAFQKWETELVAAYGLKAESD